MTIQKTICLMSVIGFVLFISVRPFSSVENQLKKVYRDFGFSRKQAKIFCSNLNELCKQGLDLKNLKDHGVPGEVLFLVMKTGMLLELSEYGYLCVELAAKEFADCANSREFPVSDKIARLLRADTKKIVFSWIIDYLNKYEKLSFYHSYVMQHDVSTYPLGFVHESNDFKVSVTTLEELSDDFGWLGIN